MKWFYNSKIMLTTLLIPLIICTAASQGTSTSKTPGEGDFGIGVMMGGENNKLGVGAAMNYVLQYRLFIAALLSFYANIGDDAQFGQTKTYFNFMPGIRYYFENIRNLYPFFQGGLLVNSYTEQVKDQTKPGSFTSVTRTTTGLYTVLGGSWFPYSSIELSAGMTAIEYQFDPSRFIIGLGQVWMAFIFYL